MVKRIKRTVRKTLAKARVKKKIAVKEPKAVEEKKATTAENQLAVVKTSLLEALYAITDLFDDLELPPAAIYDAEMKVHRFRDELNKLPSPAVPEVKIAVDPLTLPLDGKNFRAQRSDERIIRYELDGLLDGHEVLLRVQNSTSSRPLFYMEWGCRCLYTERAARAHWRNNVSTRSGQIRPHANELINRIADICAYHRWNWVDGNE